MSFGMPALLLYTMGVFFDPMAHDYGLTHAVFGAGLLASTIALAVSVPVVGMIVDRFGVRRPVMVGAALLALGLSLLGALATSAVTYVGAMALVGLIGAGASPVGYTRAVTASFDRATGTAMGVTLTLVGVGSALLPQIASAAILSFGWRWGFVCLGVLALLTIPMSGKLLRMPHRAREAEAVSVAASHIRLTALAAESKFWILLLGFTMVAASLFGFMVHLAPMARAAGATPGEAAAYASLLGLSGLLSRFAIGALCDFVQPRLVMVGCAVAAAAAMLLVAGGNNLIALAAVGLGFVVGAEVDLMSILVSRYYPGALYGRVYSLLYGPTIIGTGLSSLWIGAIADHHGYATALRVGAVLGALGGLLFTLLPRGSEAQRAPRTSSQQA